MSEGNTANSGDELSDICIHIEASRHQRAAEIERGVGTKGTIGYEKAGCYQCEGFNKECPAYYPTSKLKKYNLK
jgi:hypothetical protein